MYAHQNFEMMLVNAFIGTLSALVQAATQATEQTMGYYFVPAEKHLVAANFVLWDDSQGPEPKQLSQCEFRVHLRDQADQKNPATGKFEVELTFADQEDSRVITVDYSTNGDEPAEVANHVAQSVFTAMTTGQLPPDGDHWMVTSPSPQTH